MAKTGNVMEKMELQKQALLSYRVVYPDRHDKIEDLLSNIPSNTAIETMSYNLSMKKISLLMSMISRFGLPG